MIEVPVWVAGVIGGLLFLGGLILVALGVISAVLLKAFRR